MGTNKLKLVRLLVVQQQCLEIAINVLKQITHTVFVNKEYQDRLEALNVNIKY
jgi:hypothetical protein